MEITEAVAPAEASSSSISSSSSSSDAERVGAFHPPPMHSITATYSEEHDQRPGVLQLFLNHPKQQESRVFPLSSNSSRRNSLTAGDATSFCGSAMEQSLASQHSTRHHSLRKSSKHNLLQAVRTARNMFHKKTVKFAQQGSGLMGKLMTQIHCIEHWSVHHEQMEALWCTAKELQVSKRDAEDLAALWEALPAKVSADDRRGLEDKTPEGQYAVYRARRDVWNAVLEAQDERTSLEVASRNVSRPCVAKAMERGQTDAQEARQYCVQERKEWEAFLLTQQQVVVATTVAEEEETPSSSMNSALASSDFSSDKKKKTKRSSSETKKKKYTSSASGSSSIFGLKKKAQRNSSVVVQSQSDSRNEKTGQPRRATLFTSTPGEDMVDHVSGKKKKKKDKKKHSKKEEKKVKSDKKGSSQRTSRQKVSELFRRNSSDVGLVEQE